MGAATVRRWLLLLLQGALQRWQQLLQPHHCRPLPLPLPPAPSLLLLLLLLLHLHPC